MGKHRYRSVLVTPKMATKWLEEFNYDDNRPISKVWVDYLSRQMEKGLWKPNGEPLIFDTEDILINGQHRLSAVVQSGKTIRFDVTRGVETETFTTMDQGRNRSTAMVLGMRGEKRPTYLSAICRKIYTWDTTREIWRKQRVSPDEIWETLEIHPEARHAAEIADKIRKQVPVDASMVGFCYWLFSQARSSKVVEFFEIFSEGNAPTKKHPCITLRNRLYKERLQHGRRWDTRTLFIVFIKAWNAFDKGESLATITIRANATGEVQLPKPRGLPRSYQMFFPVEKDVRKK